MIEYPDTDQLMAGELGQWLDSNKDMRINAAREFHRRRMLASAIVIPFTGILFLGTSIDIIFKIVFSMFAMILALIWTQLPRNKAQQTIKLGINSAIASALGLHYESECDKTAGFKLAESYNLLPSHNSMKFEDRWHGEIGDSPFELHEAILTKETGDDDERKNRLVFRGFVLAITLPGKFRGTTILVPQGHHGKILGGSKDQIYANGITLNKVTLDAADLEHIFDAYSTAPDDALRLMRSDNLRPLLDVGGKEGVVLFTGNHAVMVIPAADMFESGSLDPEDDAHLVRETIDQFARVAAVVKVLSRVQAERA